MPETVPPVADKPGRKSRLSPDREQELYTCVVDQLREVGYEALSMEAVAAATRSSKATLYRRWKSKPQLVVTALRHTRRVQLSGIDTGTLRGDLHELADRMGSVSGEDTELMQAMMHAARRNEELAAALREVMAGPEMAALRGLAERAVAREELANASPAAEFLPHLVIGVVLARFPLEGCDADAEYLHRYVDAVILPALSPQG
ncbi:TetR/AcrR family transcriptional regulator [Streptomyces sp. AP-93]|uniref:TetR/AcrR family transcriptional regulator n=1 Tax=Streptomyces sp. AP-93 TaxID=2929048 RepID=UPI001FAF50EA|nr:TetR/AcrR family transcriptional regulator [Streptomyces sp. AP-93]MCJ0872627.1 TetR/AcrR family transcriptional regulator [Streptomyces sp. AP-93]